MFDEGEEDGLAALPATMGDIFFSLVAVVIIVLLSLAPLIHMPGALATQKADLLSSTILVEGEPSLVFVAEAGGLRVRQDGDRLVPLDAILEDATIAQTLRATDKDVLLIIEEDGQEAAFLFDSLASAQGVASVRQLRVDPQCRHVADPLKVACTRPGAAA